MKRRTRLTVACLCAFVLCAVTISAQNAQPKEPYTIKVMPPGGPPPRLADGHPDLSGHWLPNSAGQGVSGRFGVDPEARRHQQPARHSQMHQQPRRSRYFAASSA